MAKKSEETGSPIQKFLKIVGKEDHRNVRIYLLVTVVLLILAAFSLVTIPHGSLLSQCRSIVLQSNRDVCLSNLALSSKNGSICQYAGAQDSDSCYEAVAENTSNATDCGDIVAGTTRAACVDFVANRTGNFGLCSELNLSGADGCLIAGAAKEYDAALCAGITDPQNRSVCVSSVELDEALKTTNATYCASVTNSSSYNITLGIIRDSDAESYPKIYSNITGLLEFSAFVSNATFSGRNFCYYSMAAQFDNSSDCAYLANSTLSGSCDSITAKRSSNMTANVSSINFTAVYSACYSETGNAASCNSTVLGLRAVLSDNATLCSELNSTDADECYVYLAQSTHNQTVCSRIQNLTLNNACVQNSGYNTTSTVPSYVNDT